MSFIDKNHGSIYFQDQKVRKVFPIYTCTELKKWFNEVLDVLRRHHFVKFWNHCICFGFLI